MESGLHIILFEEILQNRILYKGKKIETRLDFLGGTTRVRVCLHAANSAATPYEFSQFLRI